MTSASIRKLSRDVVADDVDKALDDLVDQWVDDTFNMLAKERLSPKDIEAYYHAHGVSVKDLEAAFSKKPDYAASYQKQAGAMDTIRALGGSVAKWMWDAATAPFMLIWKLITSRQTREAVKHWLKRMGRTELRRSIHVMLVAQKMYRREKVDKHELKNAVQQFARLVKMAIVATVAGSAGLGHGGVVNILAALAMPVDRTIETLLEKPLELIQSHLISKGG